MSIAEDRSHMARKIWRGTLAGWSRPSWSLTKKERAILKYWEKHGHVEIDDSSMIRLTEAGRAALSETNGEL